MAENLKRGVTMELTSVGTHASKGKRTLNYLKRYWTLYLLLLLPIVYFIIFRYGPMYYIITAFKKYNLFVGPLEMEWAGKFGLEHFAKAFNNRDFMFALRNTITLNLLDLVLGFPAPVILAIILNELAFKNFKRITQTVAYMPHFLSWIIISGMATQMFAPDRGVINSFLRDIGFLNLIGQTTDAAGFVTGVPFLNSPWHWVFTYIFIGIWQSVGWNTIIYLAAITGISPELYEAASVDGAGRLRKIWHVTLPGLRPTIVVLLIMSMGRIVGSDFDRPYALTNNMVTSTSNVISTFIYTTGIKGLQFSLTTAVGLFQSIVGVFFLFGANAIAKKFGERGVW